MTIAVARADDLDEAAERAADDDQRGGGGPALIGATGRGTKPFAGRVLRGELVVFTVLALGLVLHLALVSRLVHAAAQTRQYDRFRDRLANGVAPLGQVSDVGRLYANGTPVALIEIPRLHLRQVVGEATTSAVLASGPGHQRNTPLPGQPGTSVIMGRAATYGGPFGGLHRLHPGDMITTVTGVGSATFKVIDLRNDGGPGAPQLKDGGARLILVTARGLPFLPVGVLRVDADIVGGQALASSPMPVTTVPRSELPMGTQTDSLFGLVLWLEALVAVAVIGVFAWWRVGPTRTWIALVPVGALVAYYCASELVRLLPNLM